MKHPSISHDQFDCDFASRENSPERERRCNFEVAVFASLERTVAGAAILALPFGAVAGAEGGVIVGICADEELVLASRD